MKGAIAIMEDPLNAAYTGWNVHVNVLLLVDDFLNWQTVRAVWDSNIEFKDERDMAAATKARLARRGEDIGRLSRVDLLMCAFSELAKYSARIVPDKSADKNAAGKSPAPAMVEWPARAWAEWWEAQQGFRRTRTYGRLYRIPKLEADKLDLRDVQWLGKVFFDGDYYRVDLILEDNSTTPKHIPPHGSPIVGPSGADPPFH